MKPPTYGLIIMAKAQLTLRVPISALHELRNPDLTDEENKKIFGKCFRTHGHDYGLEVTVEGEINKDSGLCCDRDFFSDCLKKEFVDKFTGKHLNTLFKNTSGEILVQEFFKLAQEKLSPLRVISVGLQETPKNFFLFKV
jgi:6-pyruvoyltetrahydropterin/6-carboxytetrahydropterin synthase